MLKARALFPHAGQQVRQCALSPVQQSPLRPPCPPARPSTAPTLLRVVHGVHHYATRSGTVTARQQQILVAAGEAAAMACARPARIGACAWPLLEAQLLHCFTRACWPLGGKKAQKEPCVG